MSKYPFLFVSLLIASGLVSCRPEPDIEFVESSIHQGNSETTLSGGNLSIVFPSDAGSVTFDLEASRKWNASPVNDRADEWCTVSLVEGKSGKATITITVKDNPDYDQRSASIIFVCGDAQRTIIVTQKQKDAILLSNYRVDVDKAGGRFPIEVKANVQYDYSISESAASWISLVETRALSTSVLTFSVLPNEEVEKREGSIVFNSSAGSEKVMVYQDGATPTIVVSSNRVNLFPADTSFKVEVGSNVDVTVEIPDASNWLSEVRTRGMSTNTYRFSAMKNESRSDRIGCIIFKNNQLSVTDTVHVIQAFEPIVVSYETVKASGRGWAPFFETVSSDPDDYRIEFSDSWLSLIKQEVISGKLRYTINVQPLDDGSSPRDGYALVYLKGYSIPDTVRIHQFEQFPVFIFTTASRKTRVPAVEGDGLLGFVFWGDGSQDLFDIGLSHSYKMSEVHKVTIEINSKKLVPFNFLENGMEINLKDLRKY